jgi:transglutaminase-like putative cysteine protease
MVLFILRLFFYLSVAGLVSLHPGISVSYDRTGLVQWFLIIPFEALIAFLPAPGNKALRKGLLALLPLLLLSVYAGGFGPPAIPLFCAGLLAFAVTFLLFRYPRWGGLSALEPFLLAWVCFRLLAFSRSGEDAAGQSVGLTQIILVWSVAVFLLHSVVVYFCLYRGSLSRSGGEIAVFALVSALALALVFFILPADFVRNSVIANLLPDRTERMIKPDDNEWGIPPGGGGRRNGRPTVPGGSEGDQPGLEGLSEHDWPGETGRGRRGSGRNGEGDGSQSRQYAVMVVASKLEPVYMGDSFRGNLDPVRGFLPDSGEILNRLPMTRLLSTWFNPAPSFDLGRERQEVFSLSTLRGNYLPYRPYAMEPTVLSEGSGPFRYIHRIVSDMYAEDPLSLVRSSLRDLSGLEKEDFAPYLEVPLKEEDKKIFSEYLNHAMEDWRVSRDSLVGGNEYLRWIFGGFPGPAENGYRESRGYSEYMEKILAILVSFRYYQYNLSNNDDASIAEIKEFLVNSKDGDCVEFSNSAALLGRLAGIPSRVVTGFLASRSLQTQAHLRGLAALRSQIRVLQEFPFDDLYLVTDAHSHSWPQFYIPGHGWLDFEATAFALPPLGSGNANMRDVVIPLFGEETVFSPVRSFPWRAVLRALGFLAAAALTCAYALRYGREILLRLGTRRGGREGARSLYLLLLARLAADGKPVKPASKTAAEYAELFPGEGESFKAFAALYSELRWREFADSAERDRCFGKLRQEYRNITALSRRKGPGAFFIRIFSLRGLAYL